MSDQPPLPDWTSAGPQQPVPAAPATPAGWYADPVTPGSLRYWDGAAWTEHQSAVATTAWAPTAPAGASFGFGESVKRAFRKWSDFEGRATQAEFWWFYLFTTLVSFVLYIPLVDRSRRAALRHGRDRLARPGHVHRHAERCARSRSPWSSGWSSSSHPSCCSW